MDAGLIGVVPNSNSVNNQFCSPDMLTWKLEITAVILMLCQLQSDTVIKRLRKSTEVSFVVACVRVGAAVSSAGAAGPLALDAGVCLLFISLREIVLGNCDVM